MTRWDTRSAALHAWELAENWLMRRLLAPGQRPARPLDPNALSPHLLRDIGLHDAAAARRPRTGGGADGRMGRAGWDR